MKWIKTLMIVLATLPGITILTLIPANTFAASYFMNWGAFWTRVANIILNAAEAYLETSIKRGYFKISMPGSQIVTAFNSESNISMAAAKGLVFDGQSLTFPEDIVIYIKDDVGVALQQGEYRMDAAGNFNFNLIKVLRPVPSPTFPLPDGVEN
jgi:hypothetical protein